MTQDFSIRRAEPKDARGIHDAHMRSILEICAKDYTEEQLNGWGRRPYSEERRVATIRDHKVWVIARETEIFGYAHFQTEQSNGKRSGYCNALYLTPEVAGRGFGRKLMDLMVTEALNEKLERIELYSTITSAAFYLKNGFRLLPGPQHVTMQNGVRIPSYPMERWLKNAPPEITLVTPSVEHQKSFLEAWDEMDSETDKLSWIYGRYDGFDPRKDFAGYISELNRRSSNPPANFVTGDVYWAIQNNVVVGRVALRHELNASLANTGGHVGYIVRPSSRRQGIATEMLRLILMTEKCEAIERLLVTCDADNLASKKTIEKNGGVYGGYFKGTDCEKPVHKNHYWINLARIPTLDTERLILTRLAPTHANDLFAYASDPEVAKTVTWDAHVAVNDSESFISHVHKALLTRKTNANFLVWALVLKTSGKMIGTISFHQYREIAGQIDYALARPHWNQGLTSEAAIRVRDFAFKNFSSIQRIQSTCLPENSGSRRVMEKMGMRFEGIQRAAMNLKGSLTDLAVYAVTRSDL